jgi:hypothetical protein
MAAIHTLVHSRLLSIPYEYACNITPVHYSLFKELKGLWEMHRDTCTDEILKDAVNQRFDLLEPWFTDYEDYSSVVSDYSDSE